MDYYEKAIKCLDDDGEKIIFRVKKKSKSMKMVTSM